MTHITRTITVHSGASLLIKVTMCSTQEDCAKPGEKLLAVNGESVLGYTVDKVSPVSRNYRN